MERGQLSIASSTSLCARASKIMKPRCLLHRDAASRQWRPLDANRSTAYALKARSSSSSCFAMSVHCRIIDPPRASCTGAHVRSPTADRRDRRSRLIEVRMANFLADDVF